MDAMRAQYEMTKINYGKGEHKVVNQSNWADFENICDFCCYNDDKSEVSSSDQPENWQTDLLKIFISATSHDHLLDIYDIMCNKFQQDVEEILQKQDRTTSYETGVKIRF